MDKDLTKAKLGAERVPDLVAPLSLLACVNGGVKWDIELIKIRQAFD